MYWAFGIGFWQVAYSVSGQWLSPPVYLPWLQWSSRIGVRPLASSRATKSFTALMYVGAAVGGVDVRQAEPALLVQGDADRVRLPSGDGLDGRVVHRSVEDAAALDAHELAAGAVDAQQPPGGPVLVHERVARDAQLRRSAALAGRGIGGVGGSVGSVGSVGPEPPSHATPLSLYAEGAGLDPVQEAVNPALTLPPVAIFPFQDVLTAVTVVPDCDQVAFHPWVTFCPAEKSKVRVQRSSAAPLLVIVTLPWKPLSHWLAAVYATVQDAAARVRTEVPAAAAVPAVPARVSDAAAAKA